MPTPLTDVSPSIVTVIERIPLKPGYSSVAAALAAGEAYDRAAGENAHHAEGYVAHAAFFCEHRPEGCSLVLIYPWLDRASAERLLESEGPVLKEWFDTFAAGPREISLLNELPVDVEEAA